MGRPRKAQNVQPLDSQNIPSPVENSVDKINLVEALQLRFINKLTYKQIGDKYGVSPQAVEQRISTFKEKFGDSEEIQGYNTNKEQLLTVVEKELLNDLLEPERRKKASLNNTAYAFERVFNAVRLCQGKSTANLQGIYGLILQIDRDERKGTQSTPDTPCIDISPQDIDNE